MSTVNSANNAMAIINTTAPFAQLNGKEALDMALIYGSYEQEIALFFIGDGVWQLVANHQGELVKVKDYLKTLDALTFYDIDHIFVCQRSLEERGLTISQLKTIDGLTALTSTELNSTLKSYKTVLTF
ncbi:sulfurtransferase complex subunit TusC [Colwellia sp. MEBiC06753]